MCPDRCTLLKRSDVLVCAQTIDGIIVHGILPVHLSTSGEF